MIMKINDHTQCNLMNNTKTKKKRLDYNQRVYYVKNDFICACRSIVARCFNFRAYHNSNT